MKNIGNLFMRLAVVWFVAGVALGVAMAASHNHGMFPVHAHINLLGWVSMALFAAFYRSTPAAAASPLARWHFWAYVPGHFVMMVTLAMLYAGNAAVEPVLAIASVAVAAGVLLFAAVVWKHTAGEPAAAAMVAPDAERAA